MARLPEPHKISFISALNNFPQRDYAHQTLERLASFIAPILRQHKTRIGELLEFYPNQPNLLGLNENHGQRVYIRLRSSRSQLDFLTYEQALDTLLHELAHNFHGPHDEVFHAKWNEFRENAEDLLLKGFTGTSFISQGHALGGRGPSREEMMRLDRAAARQAEKERKKKLSSRGFSLGGFTSGRTANKSPKEAAAAAAVRRREITQGCGDASSKETARELEQARRNGFKTKAEEDDANSLAIALALSELAEEDRKRRAAGSSPVEKGGLTWTPEDGLQMMPTGPAPPVSKDNPKLSKPQAPGKKPAGAFVRKPLFSAPPTRHNSQRSTPDSSSRPSSTPPIGRHGRPISRLVIEDDARKNTNEPRLNSASSSSKAPAPQTPLSSTWACEVCTLENPSIYLCCGACGTERAAESISNGRPEAPQPVPTWLPDSKGTSTPPQRDEPLGWNCQWCGAFMEKEWWTCSACGIMKASS